MVDVYLKGADGEPNSYTGVETVSLLSTNGETIETFVSERLIQNQVQADWTETDTNSPAYINNKPEIFEAEDELPEIKNPEEDNGKVLGVVDGKWAMMSIPESESVEQVQVDWNENDEESVSYIKNRPFGETEQRQTLFEDGTEFTLVYDSTQKCYQQIMTDVDAQKSQLWEGEWDTAYVTIGSQPYSCPSVVDGGMKMIGSALNPNSEDKFVFVISGAIAIFLYYIDFVEDTLTLPVSIKLGVTTVKQIDPLYLPDNFGVPESTASDVGKVLTVAADGAAIWEAPASGLPGVTAAENGAFLRVIDGKWAAVVLTDVSIEGA